MCANPADAIHASRQKHIKIKQWLWDIFSTGLPVDYDLDVLRKIFLVNLLNILGSFVLILLGITELVLHDHLLGIVDLTFPLFLFLLFIYLKRTRDLERVCWIGASVTGILFFFLFAYGGVGRTAFVWSFTYPLVAVSLLGAKEGTAVSLLLLAMECFVFVFGAEVAFFVSYSPYLQVRFVPAYLTILVFTIAIENIQKNVYYRLESAKSEIEETAGELRRANEALRESEEKYRTFFNTSRDCVYISSMDGSVLEMNDAAVEFFGFSSKEEAFKIKIMDLYAKPEEREDYINILRKQGYTKEYPLTLKKIDGSIINALISTVPKVDEDGNIVAFQGTIRDITDRIQAEREIKVLSKAVEQSPTSVVITDPEGNIEYVNKAFREITGYRFSEVKGKNPRILQSGETEKETYQDLWNTIAAGDVWEGELKNKTKHGAYIWEKATIGPILDADGSISHYLGLKENITEKKAMEEQLRQAQKLEALGTLAGGVAHDLNNILSGIVGYPDLLLLQLPEDSRLRKHVLAIQESGNKAAAIVRDLLTLARRDVATYEIVNLNDMIAKYLESPEYGKLKSFYPDIAVKTGFEDCLLNMLGSPVHVFNIVMNLVSNAAEAIGRKGEISISTENKYLERPVDGYEYIEEGEYVTLMVRDSGAGIDPEDLKRIFEPFYTKKKMGKSGTGLGLAVVMRTVKDHKGYIDVQSTQGEGSSFTLYFPVTRRKMARDRVNLSIKDYMGSGEKILVVDDMKEQRELLSSMLGTLGYTTEAVASGEEAVAYLQAHAVDLLILDMLMPPGMDGLETYRQVIKRQPGQKVVIASGYSETDRVREAQKLGAGKYIKKPYTLEKIGLAVMEALEK